MHIIFDFDNHHSLFSFFFFNDTATTEIYTLSLHDALPISGDQIANARRPARFSLRRQCRGGSDRGSCDDYRREMVELRGAALERSAPFAATDEESLPLPARRALDPRAL